MVFTCTGCETPFTLLDLLAHARAGTRCLLHAGLRRPTPPLDSRIKVEHFPDRRVWHIPPRRSINFIQLLGALFVGVSGSMIWTAPAVLMLVFPLIFPAVGIVLSIVGFRMSWSHITLTLDEREFRMQVRCLCWRKEVIIARDELTTVEFMVSRFSRRGWHQASYSLLINVDFGRILPLDAYLMDADREWLWLDLRHHLGWKTHQANADLAPKNGRNSSRSKAASRFTTQRTNSGCRVNIAPGDEFRLAIVAGALVWFITSLALVTPSFLFLEFGISDSQTLHLSLIASIWLGAALGVASLWTGFALFITAQRMRRTHCEIEATRGEHVMIRTSCGRHQRIEQLPASSLQAIRVETIASKIDETMNASIVTSTHRGVLIFQDRVISFGTGASASELGKAVRALKQALPK